jgi:arylsulfatase A-like enzyme
MKFFSLLLFSTLNWNNIFSQPKNINILILYSDDHSYAALGAAGNRIVHTPNLDRLAQEGMLFTRAHVMGGHQGAVCIPSRAMLLTGRYVNRLPKDGAVIPDSLVSLPEVLRQRGYTTFHVGKWHSDKVSHHRMFSDGADIFFGGMHFEKDGGQFHPTVYPFDPTGMYPESTMRSSDTFSSELYANGLIRFLNSSYAKERPFFAYIAFTSPHDPRTPPAEYEKMYAPEKIPLPKNFSPSHPFDNGDLHVRDELLLPRPLKPESVKKEIALYYGMISEMDHQVGRIMETLEKTGLRKNTLVVFAGDNGLAVGQHGLLGKQNLYEHSIRVPMIMSGPCIPENSRYDGFIYLSDIAPTLYDYLNIPPPQTVEAISHLSVFREPEKKLRNHIYNVYGNWSRSFKSEDGYKLILYNVGGVHHTQLFNLRKDPQEINDLSKKGRFQQKILELRSNLIKEMQATHDNLDLQKENWGRE